MRVKLSRIIASHRLSHFLRSTETTGPYLQVQIMKTMQTILAVGLFLCLGAAAGAAEPSHYERILLEKNIQPTADGLNKYLQGLQPSEAHRKQMAELIKRLGGADSFAAREDAMAKLLVLPVLPTESLIAAANGPDPEIRWRAKKILALGKPESEKVLYAAFQTIEQKRITGVAAELLGAIPLCDRAHLKFAARRALLSVVAPQDAAMLRRALEGRNIDVRVAATLALGKALGKKASEELHALFADSQDRVKLAAARAVADLGDRRCLKVFASMLSSADLQVRASASGALRSLSGKHFGFAAYDAQDKRLAAIAKWKTWIAGEGRTAKLDFPLKPYAKGHLGGNTLLAFGYKNKVAEYDSSGKEVWSYPATGAWSAEKLANGNVLISAHTAHKVIEVSPEKKVVWEYSVNHPINARPLANGNILLSVFSNGRVLEIDRSKKTVWQYKAQGSVYDAQRLPNGNTVVAAGNSVVEVTPDGKTVWQYGPIQCYGIQPLASGALLICDAGGRVIEVTRDKKIIWEIRESRPSDAIRLPNGNTLITGSTRFVEVTPDKKIIWSKTGCNYGTARR